MAIIKIPATRKEKNKISTLIVPPTDKLNGFLMDITLQLARLLLIVTIGTVIGRRDIIASMANVSRATA
jgi:hypothetical protein